MKKIKKRIARRNPKIKKLELIANTLRQDLIEMLLEAKSGHSGGPLGLADIFSCLYFNVLSHKPKEPLWDNRDRLILSNGHVCPILYVSLARSGYFPIEELKTLRKLGSRLQGHPHRESLPGIENTSGPLGQGLSQACGIALGAKIDKKKYLVYCVTSDGEHDEGQTWEAVLFASKYKLSNLINIIDRNNIQIDGFTENIMPLGSLEEKYRAFGWNVISINGNNIKQILGALKKAKEQKSKPTVIVAHTTPGNGVSFMENKFEWHGKAPDKEQAQLAIKELQEQRKKIEGK